MIRTESEYQQAMARLEQEKGRMEQQSRELKKLGLSRDQIKRALDPIRSFRLQLVEEVQEYERLKRGRIADVAELRDLPRLLVRLRIAKGLSQRELSKRLDVHESQVSRDERNEYHGITIERAATILEALGADVAIRCSLPAARPGKRGAVA